MCAGRVARRYYATPSKPKDVEQRTDLEDQDPAKTKPHRRRIPSPDELPREKTKKSIMPTTTKPPLEKRPLKPAAELRLTDADGTGARRRSPNDMSHIPPVLSLVKEPSHAAGPRIHILGEDHSSKYIAHAMSQIHEHVELLSWGSRHMTKNIETKTALRDRKGPDTWRVDTNGAKFSRSSDSNTHIDQLVVTGGAHVAVQALKKVEHRIDKTSTICLMNDGLGVLEDVRQKIFANRWDKEPNILLGHMTHKIAYNRKHSSIKEMRQGSMQLTPAWATSVGQDGQADSLDRSVVAREALVSSMQSVPAFHSSWTEYHQWLRFKMPSIILGAVIEPVCVMFNASYMDLLPNEEAFEVMHHLLLEIMTVLDHMPELQAWPVGNFIREESQRTRILRTLILERKNQTSALMKILQRGGYTDVNYLNGYFIGRGASMGISLPQNIVVRNIVRGLHKQMIEKRDRWIDIEEKALHIDQESRWKPFGKETRWTKPRPPGVW